MTGKTHISIGLVASATVLSISNPTVENVTDGLAIGTLGALMPDIDTGRSTISYKVRKILLYIMIGVLTTYILISNFSNQIEMINSVFQRIGLNKLTSYVPHNLKFSNTGLVIILACMIFSQFTKHRSFAHSILGLVLFTIGFKLLLGNLALYFAVGFISHMIADTLTNSGIEIFYPIRKKVALKLIHTGSVMDHVIGGLAFIYFISAMSKIL
ncbi:metal-dependent hydrolase [Clostridium felsineum]|uniref:metal-dependent hydrolase n=1 Tax=Clostridium felsineum TaxID=36839 RepID=UPI00098C3335|nr:metal-dependent hydrolase [Clostridium felsineum]URZ15482.1 hypothetical protein CLFE_015220 [Clostridium felsineum DSM 794]